MTDSALTIRTADDATQEVASDLLRRYFAEEGLAVPAERRHDGLAALLSDPRGAVLLAFRDGASDAPAGIVTVSWSASVEHLRVAEIGELYVPPAERRRGVAKRSSKPRRPGRHGRAAPPAGSRSAPTASCATVWAASSPRTGSTTSTASCLARALRPDER